MATNQRFQERLIGRGAMGDVYELKGHKPLVILLKNTVYKRQDQGLHNFCPAVIKYMFCGNREQLRIFKNECEALKAVYHANVVSMLYAEENGKTLGIVMEYCQRGSLRDVIFNPKISYSMNTVLTWGIQLFDAIDHMYQKHKLVHRDIKPDNIFVTNEYQLKIGDFGLVKVVGNGTVTGTFARTHRYMSPPELIENHIRDVHDQIKDSDIRDSHRNDVYSLGLVVWEIIERRTIFLNYGQAGAFNRDVLVLDIGLKRVTEIESPECQSEIQKIISRCTNFQRILRPPASEVLDLLAQTQKTNQFISSLPFMPTEDKNQNEPLKPMGFDDKTEWVMAESGERKYIKRFEEQGWEIRIKTPSISERRSIGSGAVGEVFELIGHEPPAVIKLVNCPSEKSKLLFQEEIGVLRKLKHPNIVTLLNNEWIEESTKLGFIMEFCERGTLRAALSNPNLIYTMKTVVCWGKQLFDALSYMFQEHKVIHRDIKPENIFLTKNFMVKIGDFGFVKYNEQSCSGSFLGTVRYMSPPQLSDNHEATQDLSQTSHRNDVYSLGLVLWEIIERRIVFSEYNTHGGFSRDLFISAINRNKIVELAAPSCQPELQEIVARCVDFNRLSRPFASKVFEDLRQIGQNQTLQLMNFIIPIEFESQKKIVRPIHFDETMRRIPIRTNENSLIDSDLPIVLNFNYSN